MRILIIDDRVPDPHFGAGFPRAYRLLLSLIQLGHKIIFLPTLKDTISTLNLERLSSYGIEVTDSVSKLKGQDITLAILSRPHNVHYYLPEIKQYLPNTKTIYDTEALWFRRYDLQLSMTGKLPGWAYRYDELGMARSVDLCWVVNDIEKKILQDNGAKKVVKLAHALHPVYDEIPFEERKDVLVVGGILEEDSSNEDALWWYLENAWTPVNSVLNCSVNITGKSHSQRLVKQTFPSVNLMGHVDNLIPLYQTHRLFVATTRFATGIPWKVHEAMAHGIPCLISSLLADQLGVTDGKEALVVHTGIEAVEKTVALYKNKELWDKLRFEGYQLVERDCDPDVFKGIIAATLAELVA
jgi:glycosyltransferase involved in cell wall biosynthesis